MKKTLIVLLTLFLGIAYVSTAYAQCHVKDNSGQKTAKVQDGQQQVVTAVYDVDGLCSMCKARIEKAALSVDGVQKAEWSIKTHKLTLTYASNVDPKVVLKKIADVGHDNEMYKASDEAYNALPSCCHYRDKKN